MPISDPGDDWGLKSDNSFLYIHFLFCTFIFFQVFPAATVLYII